MYIVHCRVIVDNMCVFQHSSSHVDCNFDARLVSKTRKYRSTKKLRKHVCVCQMILVQTIQSSQAWSTASRPIQSVEVITDGSCATTAWSVHREKCSNLSTVHSFHSASTSVSMFTINADNCTFLCSCLRVQIHHRLVTFILWWSVGSTVSRIPILQTCSVVVVLKQGLASFQHLRSSSP